MKPRSVTRLYKRCSMNSNDFGGTSRGLLKMQSRPCLLSLGSQERFRPPYRLSFPAASSKLRTQGEP
jgi:hypothetical protein